MSATLLTAEAPAVASPSIASPSIAHPVMVQRWTDVVYLHWAFDPDVVQHLLPPGVTVDVHHGRAWVGLVPFQMEGLGLPGLAPLPFVGEFPEVNVRTYVRAGGRRAVWFFSLDVDRMLPALVARWGYHLNYCVGRVGHGRTGDVVVSHVDRRWPRPSAGATTSVAVRTGPPVHAAETLTQFLTARWGHERLRRRCATRAFICTKTR